MSDVRRLIALSMVPPLAEEVAKQIADGGADGVLEELAEPSGGSLVGLDNGVTASEFYNGTAVVLRPSGVSDADNFLAAFAAGDTVYARNATFIVDRAITVPAGKTLDLTGSTILNTGWTGGSGTDFADAVWRVGNDTTIIGGVGDGLYGTATAPGVYIRVAGDRVKLISPVIRRVAREAIRVVSGSDISIENPDIEEIGVGQADAVVCNGIFITGNAPAGTPTRRVTVRGGRIVNINYVDHRISAKDANCIQVLGVDNAVVMDPDDPSYSDGVTQVLIDSTYFERADRRSVKIQSSFVKVVNTTSRTTGGVRPVGAGKKLSQLIVSNNTMIDSDGFVNGGAMLIDSVFSGNTFDGVTSSFWRSESGGMAARCVVSGNVADMNGADAVDASNCIYVGASAINGFYDSKLTFEGNKFYRAGNSAMAADAKLPIRVWGNASDIVLSGNSVRPLDGSALVARINGARTRFTLNDLPGSVSGVAGVVLLEAVDTVYTGNTPSGVAKGVGSIASGATTATMTHNLAVFGSSGAGAVFTTDATAFPTPARSAVAFSIEPTVNPTNPVTWAITATAANSATLTLSGDPGASGFSFRWSARVLG